MHRGILLSFYSSVAAFVNGKCAGFCRAFWAECKKPRRAVALRGRVQDLRRCAYSLTIKRIRVYLSCLVTVTPNLAGFSIPLLDISC